MENEKRTFKNKIENFWYFYKWQTIVFSIIAIGIIVAIFQMSSKKEGDVNLLITGPTVMSRENMKIIQQTAELYIDDYNNDGIKYLSYIELVAATETIGDKDPLTWQANNDTLRQFDTEISLGQSMIYILDDFFFERIKEQLLLSELDDILGKENVPSKTVDKYGIRLKDLKFFNQDGFKHLPKNSIVCVRSSPANESIKYGRTIESWESNCNFFKKIIEYKSS